MPFNDPTAHKPDFLSAQQNSLSSQIEKGDHCFQKKEWDSALSHYKKALEENNSEELYIKLGDTLTILGKTEDAIKNYQEALFLNSSNHYALNAVGDAFSSLGNYLQAIEHYAQAVRANPNITHYKNNLMSVFSGLFIKKMGPELQNMIENCISDPNVHLVNASAAWFSLMQFNPAFQDLYKLSRFNRYEDFEKSLKHENFNILKDEKFLTGLSRLVIPQNRFERLLTHLRRYFLLNDKARQSDQLTDFFACLALYCDRTEFIFALSDAEREKIQLLKTSKTLNDTLLYNAFAPLQSLPDLGTNKYIAALLDQTIKQRQQKKQFLDDIPALTEISDGISKMVRQQYEENPYPRWQWLSSTMRQHEHDLWGRKAKILIAGCGTGQEALATAQCFPDADITAIDLSKNSLSYGMMKAQDLGIRNVHFMHADIMRLNDIEERYDFIASSGVLHHLENPLAGWKNLVDILNPGGLMRISLYSKAARYAINAAREIIAHNDYEATADNIRRFRQDAHTLLKKKDYESLIGFNDYFYMSECRDLLFHVQEHQYDWLTIKDHLNELGLELTGLQHKESDLRRYRKMFKDDPDALNLDNWHRYEQKYPDTYPEMMRFWCRKQKA